MSTLPRLPAQQLPLPEFAPEPDEPELVVVLLVLLEDDVDTEPNPCMLEPPDAPPPFAALDEEIEPPADPELLELVLA